MRAVVLTWPFIVRLSEVVEEVLLISTFIAMYVEPAFRRKLRPCPSTFRTRATTAQFETKRRLLEHGRPPRFVKCMLMGFLYGHWCVHIPYARYNGTVCDETQAARARPSAAIHEMYVDGVFTWSLVWWLSFWVVRWVLVLMVRSAQCDWIAVAAVFQAVEGRYGGW